MCGLIFGGVCEGECCEEHVRVSDSRGNRSPSMFRQ